MIYTLLTSDGSTISFDCITSASINRTATITSHPTEEGSPISDHVFFSNITIGLSGLVTDFNLYNPKSRTAGGSVFFDSDGKIVSANTFPKEAVFNVLTSLFDNRQLVSLVESSKVGDEVETYIDCVIKSLSKKDSPENGESTMFDVELEQIRLVSASRTRTTTKPVELKTQAEVKAGAAATAMETTTTTTETETELTPLQIEIRDAEAALQGLADDVVSLEAESNRVRKLNGSD